MEECYFIDQNGNKIYVEGIYSHIGLANIMLEKDEELRKEFEKSGKRDSVDFLINDKGYMKITSAHNGYKKLIFTSAKLSERQRGLVRHFHELGFETEDQVVVNSRRFNPYR